MNNKDLGVKQGAVFKCGKYILDFSVRTHIMGILNITPDSFSDGGEFFDKEKAIEHALEMEKQGADIIDIGAESTRPGSCPVLPEEQLKRIEEVVGVLAGKLNIPISVDTVHSAVARRSLDLGASIINDISALSVDTNMGSVIAEYKAGVILMHMQGTPQTMQENPVYNDILEDVVEFLKQAKKQALACGIEEQCIAIDPGIGFGKTTKHNLKIIKHLDQFKKIEQPILIGTSRKSFIGNVIDVPVTEREFGTAASVVYSIINGADIIRVHNVKQMRQVASLTDAISRQE
ncbi:MAG: dihydropteroate synthase [PVC group bacterium]|nr:dihydropteroate synthase [PVC group bacterium]